MKWEIFSVSTVLRRVQRYLLKVYLGEYLEDFSQEELTYGLRHGKSSIENCRLKVEALNDLCDKYNLPFEFLHGSIDFMSILVPWSALFCENTVIELKGVKLVVQPKERPIDVSMFESVWGSMTSSLQLAEGCLNSKPEDDDEDFDVSDQSDGLEIMAKTIETVLANLKIKFQDFTLKIEHVPGNGSTGIALEMKIPSAEYFDEAGANTTLKETCEKTSSEPQAYSFKRVIFEGVSFFTSQFSAQDRTFLSKNFPTSDKMERSGFIPGSPEMPPTHSTLPIRKVDQDLQDEPILISKLTGHQILRLKLKQNEAIIGPKVDVEFNLGAFNLFLIPQQVHVLYELLSGLMKPGSNNESSQKQSLSVANKPMKPSDYVLVEQELLRQQQKSDVPSKSLKNQHGWSSHSLDESDEEFQLMAMEQKLISNIPTSPLNDDSMCSSISSDTRSDYAGNFIGNQRPSKSRGSTVQAMLQDQLSELTHFRGSCSSFCIIILHDDSVQESISRCSNSTSKSISNKILTLKERAEAFFEDLLTLQMSGIDFKDFFTARAPLSSICDTNHLRLMASSISIDGNEMSSSAQCIINFNLSLFQFEVLECLFNSVNMSDKPQMPTYVQVLSCDNKVTVDDSNAELKEACFKLKYQQIEYTTQSRLVKPPANKLDIQFGLLNCEFDISLTDRIQTLLNFQSSFGQTDLKKDDWSDSDVVTVTRCSPRTEITISSPNLILNIRFPIPDLRPVHDINRVPWWQQNLHKEILVLDMKDITFATAVDGDVTQSKYEIQCRDLHGLWKHSEIDDPISFLRISVDPDVDEVSQNNGFDWPRLVILSTTKISSVDLESELDEPDINYYSLSDVLMSNMDTEPSPFRSTSIVYGSKLEKSSPEKAEKNSMSMDHDEVIKPADKETMSNFIEQIVNKSECLLEFSLPTVNMVFPSKGFFELVYNRLGNDLLLWQKTISTPKASYDPSGFKVHIPGLDLSTQISQDPAFENFSIFKQFSNDSNSDSEEEESNFCSVYEYCQRQRERHKKNDTNHALTKLSITIAVTKGNLTIHPPVLDSSSKVLPDLCGKLQLYCEEGHLFFAISYKGDPNESYLCIMSEKSILYHNEAAVRVSKAPIVEPLTGSKPNNLNCIIYETESGMYFKSSACDMFRNDMLKIAVHVVHSPKQQLKSFKVAIDVSNATLRHYMHTVPQMWINQLMDFLKVEDFPVNGYIPSAVVTEFHLNLSNCAIDYRPLNLALRCAITLDNFNMSCNIAATTPSFLFRLISEEMRLFISNNIAAKKVDLKNYVCVIDSGLIDVSFRTSVDEKNDAKLELCATNNIIHIRTCADSLKALIDLMIYASANGDRDTVSPDETEEKRDTINSSTTKDSDPDNLHLLMAEAMKDYPKVEQTDNSVKDAEINAADAIVNLDDEFCILEDDPGVGLLPKNGEPQIRMLTTSPIKIVENHFAVPPGKSDVLKAPKHYPKPLVSLALREMSLVWHLYGGNDFKKAGKEKRTKSKDRNASVTFADEKNIDVDTNSSSVAFCKVTPLSKSFDANNVQYTLEHVTIDQSKETNVITWLTQGGPNRNHDVLMELQMNKVQFQREVYPIDNEYASRYILLIHDIEIRDRLKSSEINKFLYQYSSQKIPRQSHANMIEVKAVYTRPDPKRTSEECSLRLSCKPLRLNVDQDSLLFLVGFFREVIGFTSDDSSEESDGGKPNEKPANVVANQAKEVPFTRQSSVSSSETFYRYFSFYPDVLIRIDYQGKRVLMEQGALKGLLFGLAQLNSSEIKLKRLCYRHGLLGHHKVVSYAMNEWQQDILKNQLPSILGGVGPMHSFVQLFQGVKDFFYLPVVQYKRDGQIVRGLQRGASSFSTSALMAALDLFSGLVSTIQGAAIVGYDMVSPGPSVASRFQRSQETYRETSQPADIREGIATALNVVKEGINDTARTIYCVAYTEHEHKGVPGALGGVLRQIPPSLFKPIILGSKATNYVLGGVRHQLMPDAHQEDIHKWRTKNS